MKRYRKLFAAVIVPALVFSLEAAGVELPADWAEGVVVVATPLFVWMVPNEV